MNIEALEQIFKKINCDSASLAQAIETKNLLNDLPEYIAIRLENRYKSNCTPFTRVWRYEKRCTVFEGYSYDNTEFKIDVWCDIDSYEVHFWASSNSSYDIAKEFNPSIELLANFYLNNGNINNLKNIFRIPESEFISFLDSFLLSLSKKN